LSPHASPAPSPFEERDTQMVSSEGRLTLSVVIPAYNEQARLPNTLHQLERFIEEHDLRCEVLVVDSGSVDGTSAVVRQAMLKFSRLRLLRLDRRGKGLAVRTGMLAARGDVVLFADADLSWPLEELLRFPSLVSNETPVVIGSREGHGSRRLGEPAYRHFMGRVFNCVVQALAVPGIEDTQCGFKAFRADATHGIFERQGIDGFGFDVEVLFLARRLGYGIREVPLRWVHKENSRVEPLRDTLKMLADVLTVRLNGWRGKYGSPLAQNSPRGASGAQATAPGRAEHQDAKGDAVHHEAHQRVPLEKSEQEPNGNPPGDGGDKGAYEYRDELGPRNTSSQLVERGRKRNRAGQEKRETSRRRTVKPSKEADRDGDTAPGDARHERHGLRQSDGEGVKPGHIVQGPLPRRQPVRRPEKQAKRDEEQRVYRG
jgi:dolichyl-phosphate beta-glucosyltransferase